MSKRKTCNITIPPITDPDLINEINEDITFQLRTKARIAAVMADVPDDPDAVFDAFQRNLTQIFGD